MQRDLARLDLSGALRSIRRNTVEVGDCLEWTRCCSRSKPQLRVKVGPMGHMTLNVRRVQWVLENGVDPGRMLVTTRCGNAKCVNPDHLMAITQAQNGKRLARNENGSLRQRLGSARGARRIGKLTMAIAHEILASDENNLVLAQRYGVHHSTISNVRRGKSWREIGMFDQLLRVAA